MAVPAWSVTLALAVLLALAAAAAWVAYWWGRADGRLAERTRWHARQLRARRTETPRARASSLPDITRNNNRGRQPWATADHERISEWTPRPAPTQAHGSPATHRA